MAKYVLALDQGTTSSRAILFDQSAKIVSMAQQEYEQILPQPGVVEHDPEAIWETQLATAREAIKKANAYPNDIACIGITNQRETTVLWERESHKPVANAMVWQSRASAAICEQLKKNGLEPLFREKTGLIVDPYFSGTKIKHLLDHHEGMATRGDKGEVLFGTVDSFLIWRLTGGRRHITDITNASRTMLYNIHEQRWDDELLDTLNIPHKMLPEVVPSSGILGETDPQWFGAAIPIAGCAGDQQAALFGQTCFESGSAKNTYGTGCFVVMNTGDTAVTSKHNLLTTIAWQVDGKVTYALEGSIFIGGAVVQWLRDGLGLLERSSDAETLADSVEDSDGVYFVPAFVGLGAPHWDPYARGMLIGLTRGTTAAHIAKAAVQSMAFQTRDVLHAMQQDSGKQLRVLRVDGGAAINDGLLQFQADILDCPVHRPTVGETTALGAAYLAGLAVGFWNDQDELAKHWQLDREFTPNLDELDRQRQVKKWDESVRRSLHWADH